jgi:hypothetical protein
MLLLEISRWTWWSRMLTSSSLHGITNSLAGGGGGGKLQLELVEPGGAGGGGAGGQDQDNQDYSRNKLILAEVEVVEQS